ncbi:MAG: hypothetical protein R8L53_01730 [Mariprofundales bacterium]
MKKYYVGILATLVLSLGLMLTPAPQGYSLSHAAAAENMKKVRLVLTKLRTAMNNLKEYDQLEDDEIMPQEDVDRMRRVMEIKIQQLTEQAIELIQAL